MKAIHPLLDRQTEVEVIDDTNQPWILVRCKETDFHFIANPPRYERLSEEFAWEKTSKAERDRRRREERLVYLASTIAKKLKFAFRPKRNKMFDLARKVLPIKTNKKFVVLDIGCGNGKKMTSFCDRFRDIGIHITPMGVEVSSCLANDSRQRFKQMGGDVIENNAIDGLLQVQPESVDLVTMLSFLEHESQPLQLLNSVRNALKPAGAIVIKVPNFACWNRKVRGRRWAGYRFPDHVSYFTPASLDLLARQSGFYLQPQRLSDRLPTNDNMYAVLIKH